MAEGTSPYPCTHFYGPLQSPLSSGVTVKCMVLALATSKQPGEGFTNSLKFSFLLFPPLYFVQPLELYNSQEPFLFLTEASWVIIQLGSAIHLKDDTRNCRVCEGRNCHILSGISLRVQASVYLHTYCSSHTNPKLSCPIKFKS